MSAGFRFISMCCVLPLLCGCRPAYQGPPSSHFDGTRFFNPERDDHSLTDTAKWLWEMETVDWPEWIDDPPQRRPVARVGSGALRVTYINHATVLIQMDSLNILTDPIWSKRAGPLSWLGTKRVRAPGVRFEQLPQIDVVLVSHDHFDHLDLPTIEMLYRRDHPTFIVGLGVGQHLRSIDVPSTNIVELDWWQSHTLAPVRIVYVPARHSSGRAPFSAGRTLWGGFVLDAPAGQIYFAGDTARGAFVDEIAERFSRVRLAIIPIGSYEKRWFMKNQHINPAEAVAIHRRLRASQSMGMHYATFAEHPEQRIDAHEKDLAAALAARGVPRHQFWVPAFGEGLMVVPRR